MVRSDRTSRWPSREVQVVVAACVLWTGAVCLTSLALGGNWLIAKAWFVGGVAAIVPMIVFRDQTRELRQRYGTSPTVLLLFAGPLIAATNVLMRLPLSVSAVCYVIWLVILFGRTDRFRVAEVITTARRRRGPTRGSR